MNHTSNLKLRDFTIGNFIVNVSRRQNQVIYAVFAFIFTYADFGLIPTDFNIIDVLAWGIIFIINLLLIFVFVFFFSILLSLLSPNLKKGVLGKHEFDFLSDEFIEKTAFNEERLKYSTIDSVFMRFGTIYILLSGHKMHILPKRDFNTQEDKSALVTFLRNKIGHVSESN